MQAQQAHASTGQPHALRRAWRAAARCCRRIKMAAHIAVLRTRIAQLEQTAMEIALHDRSPDSARTLLRVLLRTQEHRQRLRAVQARTQAADQ